MFYAYSSSLSETLASLSVVTVLLFYTVYIAAQYRWQSVALLIAPCLIAIRFVIVLMFTSGTPEIVFLVDTLIAGIYISVLYSYHRKLWIPIVFFLLSAIANIMNFLMLFYIIPSWEWSTIAIRLYGLIAFVALGISVYAVGRTEASRTIKLYLPMIAGIGVGIAFGVLSLFLHPLFVNVKVSLLVYNFINPVALGAFFFPVMFMIDDQSSQLKNTVHRQTQSLDSIFDFMGKVGAALGEHEGVERILDFFVYTFAGYAQADGCAVFILNELQESLEVRSAVGFYPPPYHPPSEMEQAQFDALEEYFRKTPVSLKQGVIGQTFTERRVHFIPVVDAEKRKEIYGDYLTLGEVGSFIAIPLIVGSREFGVISIVRSNTHPPFSDLDFVHAEIFSRYISLIIDNRNDYLQLLEKKQIEQEIGIASQIQRSLLPKGGLSSSELDISSIFFPLQGVSGDYYDVVHYKNSTLALVCDIAGKGISACLLMVLLRTALHIAIRQYGPDKLDKILTSVNEAVLTGSSIDRFATMALVTYIPEKKELLYGNAGHLPLIIWRQKEQKVVRIDMGGLPIGIDAGFSAEVTSIPVEKGDYMLLFTDGIPEIRNDENEEYQLERLVTVFSRLVVSSSDAKQVLRGISADIKSFLGKNSASDDQTLLIIKVI